MLTSACIYIIGRYNWEHYGNPDGPQAMQFGIGLPAWIVEEKNSVFVLGVYALIFMIGLPVAVWYWWSRSSKYSGEQVITKAVGKVLNLNSEQRFIPVFFRCFWTPPSCTITSSTRPLT